MRIHVVKYYHPDDPDMADRVVWGRSFKWAAHERSELRFTGWKIKDSFCADIGKGRPSKKDLVEWLNANIRVWA